MFFWVRLHTIPPFPTIVILSFLRSIVGTIVLRSSNCRCRCFVLSDAWFLPMVRKRPFYDRWSMFSRFPKGSLSGRFGPIHRVVDVSYRFAVKNDPFFVQNYRFPVMKFRFVLALQGILIGHILLHVPSKICFHCP